LGKEEGNMALADQSIKVVLLGDTGTGKTSLALRFTRNEFLPYCESTIGASFMTKAINILPVDSTREDQYPNTSSDERRRSDSQLTRVRRIEFNLWDTAGQEKYASLAPMYYRNANAGILVFDICSRASFQVLKKWAGDLQSSGPADIILAVCGNKSDLADERTVSLQEAQDYAQEIGAFYVETSARDDVNVRELFVEVGRRTPRIVGEEHALDASARVDLFGNAGSRHRCC
jgi:small GTP-binding protein